MMIIKRNDMNILAMLCIPAITVLSIFAILGSAYFSNYLFEQGFSNYIFMHFPFVVLISELSIALIFILREFSMENKSK